MDLFSDYTTISGYNGGYGDTQGVTIARRQGARSDSQTAGTGGAQRRGVTGDPRNGAEPDLDAAFAVEAGRIRGGTAVGAKEPLSPVGPGGRADHSDRSAGEGRGGDH